MKDTKAVKAYCKKAKQYFLLEVKKYGSVWKVVNFTDIPQAEGELAYSEVKQASFETNENLLACKKCGTRKVGGCSCTKKHQRCRLGATSFDCVYCNELEIDYSLPSADILKKHAGEKVSLPQGKEVKIINFSNVEWTKFDNIQDHPAAPIQYHEPKVHIVLKDQNIEFHGYNVSRMDEGVYYAIGEQDDFEIECSVDTSTIQPHPGGEFYISMGILTAKIGEKGGTFLLNGKTVATVGNKFKMRLSLTMNGKYSVYINDNLKGEEFSQVREKTKIIFGFRHDSHHCHILSHAYISGIKMMQFISHDKNNLRHCGTIYICRPIA